MAIASVSGSSSTAPVRTNTELVKREEEDSEKKAAEKKATEEENEKKLEKVKGVKEVDTEA